MNEPESRRNLQDVDTNINININNDAIADTTDPVAKKRKTAPRILTFSLAHSSVQVQLLSTQTIHDLVDIICRESTIGYDESVDSHMWNLHLLPHDDDDDDEVYESGDFPCTSELRANQVALADLPLVPKVTKMMLHYDYGEDWEYTISFEDASVDPSVDDESLFPRRKPAAVPDGLVPYVTDKVDLNALFPTLNKWAFHHESRRLVELNLFQPGRKQNFGFVEKRDRTLHMIFLPCRAGTDLSVYLHCFDYASQFKSTTNNWYSMVVFPEEHPAKLADRYSRELEPGLVAMRVASYPPTVPWINSFFPKLAALAGYQKDKNVPRGWLTYKNKILRICSGAAASHTSNAPKGTAFDGKDHFEPADESAILFKMDVEIESLHDLFCLAEGLLMTR